MLLQHRQRRWRHNAASPSQPETTSMAIYQLDQFVPRLGAGAWVADNALVIGNVELGDNASVWFNAVLRGDGDDIVIGAGSNVQDGAVLHVDPGFPLRIGERVSIGHQAMLHGCTIGDGSLIAIKAVVLNGAVIGDDSNVQDNAVLHTDPGCPITIGKGVSIGHQVMLHGCTIGDGSLIGVAAVVLNSSVVGKDCLVGAGAVITENKSFPDRSVVFGAPAKAVREVTEDNIARLRFSADSYVQRGSYYKPNLKLIG